jgi:hypothetical protein
VLLCLNTVPGPPVNVTATEVSGNLVSVTWKSPSTPNGIITGIALAGDIQACKICMKPRVSQPARGGRRARTTHPANVERVPADTKNRTPFAFFMGLRPPRSPSTKLDRLT